MRRLRILVLAAVVVLVSIVWSTAPASAGTGGPAPVPHIYLALGDSLSVGWQPAFNPNGTPVLNPDGTVAAHRTDEGYPDQLLSQLQMSNPSLQLVKLGCEGETTETMRNGQGPCAGQYASSNQLTDAKDYIAAHRNEIAYVSLDIGANDVLHCVSPERIDAGCFSDARQRASTNLDAILRDLRQSINQSDRTRTARVAGMTYYDPVLASWFFKPALATASVGYQTVLNGTLAARYLQYGFRVAPVAYAFQTYDFRTSSGVPVNVAAICRLTWMCALGNIHANSTGYKLIADTFARTLRW